MDDVIILHQDKRELRTILEEIDIFLKQELKLQLNNKTAIRPIKTGVEFVGYRIWPTHRKLRKSTVKKMKSRFKYLKKAFKRGEIDAEQIRPTLMSYLGMMKHANCYRLKKKLIKSLIFSHT
ncbi:hypothetical protein ABEV04_05755 [Heyndrickxia faecalis]|uniref:hypothetical protein n=1 Tax=Heyndrickxia TaxID=2837504 RepID=UPI002E1C1BD6|nr:hypothetical protein [Weizmannia sp. CD-2023]